MLLRHIAALLPVLAAARAFKNAAPFLMVSDQPLGDLADELEIETADNVLASLSQFYADESRVRGRHALVSQPGLTTVDLQSMPKFAAVVNAHQSANQLRIANVIGDLDVDSVRYEMATTLDNVQEADGVPHAWHDNMSRYPLFQIKRAGLPAPEKERKAAISALDAFLETLSTGVSGDGPSTIVLVSRPAGLEESRYEMQDVYQGVLKQDLKRNTDAVRRASNNTRSNTTDNFQDGLPLFERYAYFSPALFMGLLVSILLITILYYAVSAIAGLEVSYMAFSKEMAPQNQKKEK